MPRIIAQSSNYTIEYDKGSFDDWCIYLIEAGKKRYAPRDPEYFTFLQKLGQKFGSTIVYQDFVDVYNATGAVVNNNVLTLIKQQASKYGADSSEFEKWMIIIHAGMVAEANKANTKLGKRIKHLGIYQILFQNKTPNEAANYSRGKAWRDLDKEMKAYNF